MAGRVVPAGPARAGGRRPGHSSPAASELPTQFRHDGTAFEPCNTPVGVDERPPMETTPEYRSGRAGVAG